MDTLQAILARRSVRQYRPEEIPPEYLYQILEAGRQAPSAANRQSWHFVVVSDPAQKERVAEACNGQMWMAQASHIIVAVGLPQVSAKWYKVDVAIALENMVVAARSLGYGTCWVGAFDQQKVKAVCGIPAEAEVVACTPLGVPAGEWPAARARKGWDEVFSADLWGRKLK